MLSEGGGGGGGGEVTVSKQRLQHHTRPRRSVIAQLPIEALIPADACLQIY